MCTDEQIMALVFGLYTMHEETALSFKFMADAARLGVKNPLVCDLLVAWMDREGEERIPLEAELKRLVDVFNEPVAN